MARASLRAGALAAATLGTAVQQMSSRVFFKQDGVVRKRPQHISPLRADEDSRASSALLFLRALEPPSLQLHDDRMGVYRAVIAGQRPLPQYL